MTNCRYYKLLDTFKKILFCFWSRQFERISGTPFVLFCFWSSPKESWKSLVFILKCLERISELWSLVFEVDARDPFCFVLEVVWKDLGDLLSCFWSNVKGSRRPFVFCFWSSLKESRGPLIPDIWSSLKDPFLFFLK